MVRKKIPKTLEKKINEFVDTLKKDELPIDRVVLFGSYAKGTEHKWSDVDLCVVSTDFEDSFDATNYLFEKTKFNMKYTIEPIGFSPKDFQEGSPLINEIKKTGVIIKI